MTDGNSTYLSLDKLRTYILAREFERIGWKIYLELDWKDKKLFGDQFIMATDSVGANVAEGYGRFHYLDKTKFYLNGRGSLLESRHWFEVMVEREKITKENKSEYLSVYRDLRPSLNVLIKQTRSQQLPELPII